MASSRDRARRPSPARSRGHILYPQLTLEYRQTPHPRLDHNPRPAHPILLRSQLLKHRRVTPPAQVPSGFRTCPHPTRSVSMARNEGLRARSNLARPHRSTLLVNQAKSQRRHLRCTPRWLERLVFPIARRPASSVRRTPVSHGVKTRATLAVSFTPGRRHDSQDLPDLVEAIPGDASVHAVMAARLRDARQLPGPQRRRVAAVLQTEDERLVVPVPVRGVRGDVPIRPLVPKSVQDVYRRRGPPSPGWPRSSCYFEIGCGVGCGRAVGTQCGCVRS